MNENTACIERADHDSRDLAVAIGASFLFHIFVIIMIMACSQSFFKKENILNTSMDVDLTAFSPPVVNHEPKISEPVAQTSPEKIESKDVTVPPPTVEPKPIEPLKIPTQRIEPKPVEQAKIPSTRVIVPAQIPTKAIVTRDVPIHTLPTQYRINPAIKPNISDRDIGPPPTAAPRFVGPSPSALHAIRQNNVAAPIANERSVMPPSNHLPLPVNGVQPEMLKRSRFSPIAKNDSPMAVPPPVAKKIKSTPAPPPIRKMIPSLNKEPMEDLVIINSSVLGSSDRVKNLKRDIQKKAQNMSPADSPYTYKVKGYTCTLTIKGGANSNKVIIDFSPPDAPFEVVSALERILR
jgi:hypothetical protein